MDIGYYVNTKKIIVRYVDPKNIKGFENNNDNITKKMWKKNDNITKKM